MNTVTKELRDALGDGKMISAKSLKIKIIKTDNNYVELKVFVENKWGVFQIYPNIDTRNTLLSRGNSLQIMTGKDFKVKTRISIS